MKEHSQNIELLFLVLFCYVANIGILFDNSKENIYYFSLYYELFKLLEAHCA